MRTDKTRKILCDIVRLFRITHTFVRNSFASEAEAKVFHKTIERRYVLNFICKKIRHYVGT